MEVGAGDGVYFLGYFLFDLFRDSLFEIFVGDQSEMFVDLELLLFLYFLEVALDIFEDVVFEISLAFEHLEIALFLSIG